MSQPFVQNNVEEAARDIAAFVAIFFEYFNEYQGRPFHMAGESYGVSISALSYLIVEKTHNPARAAWSLSTRLRYTTRIPDWRRWV